MSSIRGKIVLAYALMAVLGAVFMVFTYADLRYLEARIDDGADVSALREDTLEMRRHEKNYLLYHEPQDMLAALELAESVQRQLVDRPALFTALFGAARLGELRRAMAGYHRLMERQWDSLGLAPRMPEAQARELRELGHLISARAEELARREREALLASMRGAMLALIGFAAGVAVLGLVAGQVLSRVVVRPLRLLEQELQPIAAGHFNAFHAPSRDREIISLTDALNRMLAELETRRLQVLQADKLASLGVLASGVAHELNNPLGNISTTAQIMSEELDSADPAAQRDWLNQIDTETERARRIVRTLLDYARRRDFHAEPVALEEVLDKSFLLLGKRRPAADAVRLELEPDLVVEVDEQRMQQVFINLFRNALDAGATRLTVSARHATWAASRPGPGAPLAGAVANLRDDRRLTVIRVADNGPGIPSEDLARVFDPFFTTRAPGQGVGLGLYVAQEIIAEHGGCISAENPPGGGAVFTLCLPCPQSSGKPS